MPTKFVFIPPFTKVVFNPNLLEDTIEILQLNLAKSELKQRIDSLQRQTDREKLATFIDRAEFIQHLEILKANAQRKGFQLDNQEVVGVDWDIDSLRIYLALTCIDIFSGNYTPFYDWVLSNMTDFDSTNETIELFLKRKKQAYEEEYRLSTGFIKAFTNAPTNVQRELSSNLTVVSKTSRDNDTPSIARYLYRIRNKYTHEGRRFHRATTKATQVQYIGERDMENNNPLLMIAPKYDLVEGILKVAKAQVVRKLKLESNVPPNKA